MKLVHQSWEDGSLDKVLAIEVCGQSLNKSHGSLLIPCKVQEAETGSSGQDG